MKEYKIFSEDSHEYTVIVTETDKGIKYTLKFSENRAWTEPGKEVISVIDEDCNFVFSKKLGREMDCSSLIELKILFNVIDFDQTNMASPYYAIECSETVKV